MLLNKAIFKLAKYLFLPFFLVIFFAALLGRERIAVFYVGEQNSLVEEYLIIALLLVLYDYIKFLIEYKKDKGLSE